VLAAAEEVPQVKRIFFKQAGDVRLNESEAGARQDGGHARQQATIDDFGLGEVGDFGRAGYVRGSGEKGVLDDGAKKDVGAEALGGTIEEGEEVGEGVGVLAGDEAGVGASGGGANGKALAVVVEEEERAAFENFHLSVVTGAVELLVAGEKIGGKGGVVFEGAAIERRGEAMEARVERVEENQAVASKEAGEELGEGCAEGFLRAVGVLKSFGDEIGGGTVERRNGLSDEGGDGVAQANFADALAGRAGGSEFETREIRAGEPPGVVDFGEVVVFGGEPEDGDGVMSARSEIGGETNDGERFVETVGGAGEEADLLSGDNGDGTGSEAVEIFLCGRAAAETEVLFAEDFDDGAAQGGVRRGAVRELADGAEDARLGGRMGVKVGEAGEVVVIGGEKARGVGELSGRNGATLHRRGHDTWGRQRGQSRGNQSGQKGEVSARLTTVLGKQGLARELLRE